MKRPGAILGSLLLLGAAPARAEFALGFGLNYQGVVGMRFATYVADSHRLYAAAGILPFTVGYGAGWETAVDSSHRHCLGVGAGNLRTQFFSTSENRFAAASYNYRPGGTEGGWQLGGSLGFFDSEALPMMQFGYAF